jgi:glyoxylase-like metal-dependent hydrolase (beta-lactamase superfamily II)
MDTLMLREGLWRWTARHPDWKQGEDWEELVGCVYYEAPEAVVLVDPLVPAGPDEQERFHRALDRDVERLGLPVAVLLTVHWHERSATEVAGRYRGAIWRHGDDAGALPAGIEAFPARGAEEVVFWIPEHGAVIAGDVLLGDGAGGVRLCPASWLPGGYTLESLRADLRPLQDLPVELLLVSHGEPVTQDARARLTAALDG